MAPLPERLPTPLECRQLGEFVRGRFGIELKEGKRNMVAGRVLRAAAGTGCASMADYLALLRSHAGRKANSALAAALTTNFTFFFREAAQFEVLRKRVLAPQRGSRLVLWSAACSSGEEAYSMAITAIEELGSQALDSVRILASDISEKVLIQGARGIYPEQTIGAVPDRMRRRYFLRGEGEWRGWFRAKPELRKMVSFRRINLTRPAPVLPPFQAILCRNLILYFDPDTRSQIFGALAAKLAPGGMLAVGQAECAGLSAPELVPAGAGCWIRQ